MDDTRLFILTLADGSTFLSDRPCLGWTDDGQLVLPMTEADFSEAVVHDDLLVWNYVAECDKDDYDAIRVRGPHEDVWVEVVGD